MLGMEQAIESLNPDLVLVIGDTNTTLAGSLTAAKAGVPVAHVEAGVRSFDLSMPEEINRRLTDHVSVLLFAPTRTTVRNLKHEAIPRSGTFQTGDVLVDVLRCSIADLESKRKHLLQELRLAGEDFVYVTLHRPENVDYVGPLSNLVRGLLSTGRRFVFPIHPRTRKQLEKFRLLRVMEKRDDAIILKPLDYLDNLALLSSARVALTDSGGIQREAFLLGTRCMTVRRTTEWPETLEGGANSLIPPQSDDVCNALTAGWTRHQERKLRVHNSPFGDGHASSRIARVLSRIDMTRLSRLSREFR